MTSILLDGPDCGIAQCGREVGHIGDHHRDPEVPYAGISWVDGRLVAAEDIVDCGIGTDAQYREAAEWLRIEAELRQAAWLTLPLHVRVWRSRPRFYEARRRVSLAIAALRGQLD